MFLFLDLFSCSSLFTRAISPDKWLLKRLWLWFGFKDVDALNVCVLYFFLCFVFCCLFLVIHILMPIALHAHVSSKIISLCFLFHSSIVFLIIFNTIYILECSFFGHSRRLNTKTVAVVEILRMRCSGKAKRGRETEEKIHKYEP